MNDKEKESIIGQLTYVAQELLYTPGNPLAGKKILEAEGDTGAFTYSEEGWAKLRTIVEQLLDKHKWSEKYSEKYLENKLTDILHDVVSARRTTLIPEAINSLVGKYEGLSERRTIIVPLAGFEMEMDELAIGNVMLKNMKDEAGAKLGERCRSIMMRMPGTAEQNDRMFKGFEEHYLARIKDKVCIEMTVVAEPSRGEEIAIDEARRVIDLLRLSILLLDPDKDKKVIGLQGEACDDGRATVSIKENDSNISYMGSMVFHRFILTKQIVERMRNIGVFVLSDLLQKKALTEFEKVILRAVHWLASAQAQYENENALLNLVTCLEAFLTPSGGDPITVAIAEGVAILTVTGLEERKRRKKRIRDFYGMRSKLTHGGHGTIRSSDLKELANIAGQLTVRMIRRKDEFPNQEALRSWIDDQKLAGP